MNNPTIEPEIQEIILETLPDEGNTALEVMAQLSANMVLSIPGAKIDLFLNMVRAHYEAYCE
jgi:hypothetical protein